MTICEVAPLKAPFPYFGGKSRVASLVWERFGDVKNYVEPFAGSLAMLLSRPHPARTETVNDLDCYLANFWRALKADPGAVAAWADCPVNEADLHARHVWLMNREDFREAMKTDPDFYDAKVAGWWVWGACAWIGSGWCAAASYERHKNGRCFLSNAGMGINRPLPHVGDAGRGINRKRPFLGGRGSGCGINRQLPHVGDAGRGERLLAYFQALAERLDRVRVCCGDWRRVLGPSVTHRHGITGIFLDPPYSAEAKRARDLYATDDESVAHKVREWALANADNPLLRIALCGYEGEHKMPRSWECVAWKAKGGYASQSRGGPSKNSRRERVWFSPQCLAAARRKAAS